MAQRVQVLFNQHHKSWHRPLLCIFSLNLDCIFVINCWRLLVTHLALYTSYAICHTSLMYYELPEGFRLNLSTYQYWKVWYKVGPFRLCRSPEKYPHLLLHNSIWNVHLSSLSAWHVVQWNTHTYLGDFIRVHIQHCNYPGIFLNEIGNEKKIFDAPCPTSVAVRK